MSLKDVKIKVRVIGGFLITDVLLLLILFSGYSTAKSILNAENPEKYISSYGIFTCVMFVVIILLSGLIVVPIINTFKKSLEPISDAAKKMSDGEIDFKIDKYADDEFGMLADNFNEMISNMKKQVEVAEDVAEGNLMVSVSPRSDRDLLGNALKKMVKRNHHSLSNINESAYQVMTSSSQVASASEALAQGSTEQASAIEEITVSISDIAVKTKENAQQANNAEKLMVNVITDVNNENDKMKEMISAMDEINKSSESISKIIKVIDDIAFQTNILALNAAVEAARAGEVGKGFAVVAEEVRNLAAKSSQAAAETAELIETSIRKVEVGSKIADETAKSLVAMTGAIKETEKIVCGIAEASNYQATAIAQVDKAIEQVSQVVQTNSATSEQCAAASIELSDQAKKMRELISVYRLGDNKRTTAYQSASWNSAEDDYDDVSDRNEQIISLRDGFGKY